MKNPHFTLNKFRENFAARHWRNGQRLYQLGYVDDDSIEQDEFGVSGEVQSESTFQRYDVAISYYDHGFEADCSCPVASFCKHAAALCIAIANEDSATSEVETTSQKELDDWFNSLPDSNITPQYAVFLFVVSEFNSHYTQGIKVQVKRSRVLKSGNYSKSCSNEYLSSHLLKHKDISPQDKHLLATLMAAQDSYGVCHDLSLLMQLIDTGRCFWQKVGDTPIQMGETIDGQFIWQDISEDIWKLNSHINQPHAIKICTQPPAYYCPQQGKIGEIDFGISAQHAANLLTMPAVNQQQLQWLTPQLMKKLGEDAAKFPLPKFSKQIELIEPQAILILASKVHHPESCHAILWFDYDGMQISPHQESQQVKLATGQTILRNTLFEQNAIEQLVECKLKPFSINSINNYWYNETPKFEMRLTQKNWFAFLHQKVPYLREQGWRVDVEEDFYYQQKAQTGDVIADIDDSEQDYFSLSMQIEVDGQQMPLFPILRDAIDTLPKAVLLSPQVDPEQFVYIDMAQGHFLPLPLSQIKPLLDQFVELFMPNALNGQNQLTLSRFQGHQTLNGLDQQGIVTSGENNLRNLAKKLANFNGITPATIPVQLRATLRDYQHTGVNWLQFLREYQLGGILADDMGLGKTLQTLTHLLIEQQEERLTQPALIVAPTSVIFNWQQEAKRFTPTLNTLVVHGAKRKPMFDQLDDYDLVITSYALLQRDAEHYQQHHFHYLVLDEAQYLKNSKTKLYSAMQTISARHKVCLTGTPMENHLGELWALFNLALPGFLGHQTQFNKLFRTPIEKQQNTQRQQLLSERLQPFMLRRTKDKIAAELPQKSEIIRTVRFDTKQAELYETVRLSVNEKLQAIIKGKGFKRSQIEILDAMLKLRQVCCHPQLLSLKSAAKIQQSAKMELLMEMLPELIAEGRRILLFSQFTSMLALIEEQLDKHHIAYVKLTGSTKDRQAVLQQFKQGNVPLFLISLKAGGTGLNLTEADTVIHYDPWWNPAVENQATDRAHRIGQDKPVFVYKLLVEGSIEEKIQQLQAQKHALAQAILTDGLAEKSTNMTQEVLQSLLAPMQTT